MTYKVELARQAEKALDRLDRVTEKRLRDRLKELSLNPYDPRLSNDVIMEEGKKYSRVGTGGLPTGWKPRIGLFSSRLFNTGARLIANEF